MATVTRQDKEQEAQRIRDAFDKSVAAVLLDPRGVDVPLTTELRARFRAVGVEYRVVKNSLVRKALEGTELATDVSFGKFLVGMTGIAWSYEDPSAAAKVVKNFRKEGDDQEKLTIKGAVLDSDVFAPDQVESQLATLPGKDEIRAMLLAQLLAPAQSLVRQLHAPGQNFSYLMDARRRQLEEQG